MNRLNFWILAIAGMLFLSLESAAQQAHENDSTSNAPPPPSVKVREGSDYLMPAELNNITEEQRHKILEYVDPILGESFMMDPHVKLCREKAEEGNNDALAAIYSIAEGKKTIDAHIEKNHELVSSGMSQHEVYKERRSFAKKGNLKKTGKVLLNLPKSMLFCEKLANWSEEYEQDDEGLEGPADGSFQGGRQGK